ncbi:hypothetical protein J6590_077390 [Homalodisca vitripennis]|nr:hypothetical protein J6590_077390 [Homalodisca vitripennis]
MSSQGSRTFMSASVKLEYLWTFILICSVTESSILLVHRTCVAKRFCISFIPKTNFYTDPCSRRQGHGHQNKLLYPCELLATISRFPSSADVPTSASSQGLRRLHARRPPILAVAFTRFPGSSSSLGQSVGVGPLPRCIMELPVLTLWLGAVLLLRCVAEPSGDNSTPASTDNTLDSSRPILSTRVSNSSKYHDQVEFINHFLLSPQEVFNSSLSDSSVPPSESNDPPTNQSEFTSESNNTTPTDLPMIPVKSVPAAFSSVIDTVPIHPRIPRRSLVRRRSRIRQNRYSTRVRSYQPAKFLLPPFENELSEPLTTLPPTSTFSTSELSPAQVTPSAVPSREAPLPLQIKSGQRESSPSVSPPQYRKVFIPPPLRYLLPPFFYENYIAAQPSSSQLPPLNKLGSFSPTINVYYSTIRPFCNKSCYNQDIETSSIAPIIVIETASEGNIDLGTWKPWNHQSSPAPPVPPTKYPQSDLDKNHQSSPAPTVPPTKFPQSDLNKDVELIQNSEVSQYQNQIPSTTERSPQNYSEAIHFRTTNYNKCNNGKCRNSFEDINLPLTSRQSTLRLFSSTTAPPTDVQPSAVTSTPFQTFPSKTTTPSTSAFPVLRGPNIEQVLFETGDFQIFDENLNDSVDTTVSMMNRPLLAQEVARAGMKITASLQEDRIRKGNVSRGSFKFNHLDQFNFQGSSLNGAPKTSRLAVAESSYYNDRRTSRHPGQQIVGTERMNLERRIGSSSGTAWHTPTVNDTDRDGSDDPRNLRVIPGRPGKDYPILSSPPSGSNFSCRSVGYHRGYVADPSTGCQHFLRSTSSNLLERAKMLELKKYLKIRKTA